MSTTLNIIPSAASLAASIASSRTFARSEQLRKLLIYLCDDAAGDSVDYFSEFQIGTQVFSRRNFDPRLDNIVRAQMLRLRKKLEDYYLSEDASSPWHLYFEKNSYRPLVRPRLDAPLAPADPSPEPLAPLAPPASSRPPLPVTLLLCILVVGGAFAIGRYSATTLPSSLQSLVSHPLWVSFAGHPVKVAVSTPLFFRNERGYFRDYRFNLPADIGLAEQESGGNPGTPSWDSWSSVSDLHASIALDRLLTQMRTDAVFQSARTLSSEQLLSDNVIILGHPRGAPVLIEALAPLRFGLSPQLPGQLMGGFIDRQPPSGGPKSFGTGQPSPSSNSDESISDHILLTHHRAASGRVWLSVFGNRIQSPAYALRRLIDPAYLALLPSGAFLPPTVAGTTQIVFRLDYLRGTPIGLKYISHHRQ